MVGVSYSLVNENSFNITVVHLVSKGWGTDCNS